MKKEGEKGKGEHRMRFWLPVLEPSILCLFAGPRREEKKRKKKMGGHSREEGRRKEGEIGMRAMTPTLVFRRRGGRPRGPRREGGSGRRKKGGGKGELPRLQSITSSMSLHDSSGSCRESSKKKRKREKEKRGKERRGDVGFVLRRCRQLPPDRPDPRDLDVRKRRGEEGLGKKEGKGRRRKPDQFGGERKVLRGKKEGKKGKRAA